MLSRVGISLEDQLLDQFDALIEKRGYSNRSEAIRDLIREELVKEEWATAEGDGPAVAVVCLVFDHHTLELGKKLTHIQHENHMIVVSTMHMHMDEHNCLEVLLLRGRAAEVLKMGNNLISTRGVKLGKMIPATIGEKL